MQHDSRAHDPILQFRGKQSKDEAKGSAMRKLQTATIKVGQWLYDHNEFTIKHADPYGSGYSGYVDTNDLDENEVIDWLKHFVHTKDLSDEDLEDFLSICKVVLSLDRSEFRRLLRRPATAMDTTLRKLLRHRSRSKPLHENTFLRS
jgi:hypothetical protein